AVSITEPAGLHNGAAITPNFSATDAHLSTTVCKVDTTVVACGAAVSAAHGTHTFTVTATDTVGNTTTVVSNFEVDSVGPAVSITSPTATTYATSALIPFTATTVEDHPGAGSHVCTLKKGAAAATSIPCGTSLDPVALGNATYVITDTAPNDTVGNPSNTSSVTFTINIAPAANPPHITVGPVSGLTITDPTPEWSFVNVPAGPSPFQCKVDAGAWSTCTSPFGIQDTRTYALDGSTTGGVNGFDTGDGAGGLPNGVIDASEAGSHTFMVRTESSPGVFTAADTASFYVGPFDPTFTVSMNDPSDPSDVGGNDAGAHPDVTLSAAISQGDPTSVVAFAPRYTWGSNNAVPPCSYAEATTGACTAASKIGNFSMLAKANRVPHDSIIGLHDLTLTGEIFMTEKWAPGEAAGAVARVNIVDTDGRNYGQVNQRVHLVVAYAKDYDPQANTDDPLTPWIENTSVANPYGIKAIIEDVPRISPGTVDGAQLELHGRSVTGTIFGNASNYENPLLYNSYECVDTTNQWRGVVTTFQHTGSATLPNTINSPREADIGEPTYPYSVDNCDKVPFAPLLEKTELYDLGDPSKISSDPANPPGKLRPLGAHAEVSAAPGDGTLKYATLNLPASIRQRTAGIAVMCASSGDPSELNADTNGDSVNDLAAGVTTIDPYPTCDPDWTKVGSFTVDSPLLSTSQTGELFLEDTKGPLPSIYGVVNDPDLGLNVRIRAASGLDQPTTVPVGSGFTFITTRINASGDNSQTPAPSLPISKIALDLTGTPNQGGMLEVAPNCATEDAGSGNAESWTGTISQLIAERMYFGSNTDAAGNPSTAFTCESVGWLTNGPRAGDTTNNNNPTWDATRSMTWTGTSGSRRRTWYECGNDRGVWNICGNTTNVVAPGTSSFVRTGLSFGGVKADGNHRFAIRMKFLGCAGTGTGGTIACTPSVPANTSAGSVLALPGGNNQTELVYKIDTAVPTGTSILSGPANGASFVGPNPPIYVFGSSDLRANFQCSIDAAVPVWASCPSGQPLPGGPRSVGNHFVDVRAWDGVNGDPVPVHRTFTILP
ncbi:MAG: hypothetical protein JHC87_06470, partial [Thermoleophilaceae bacterium]|nr:hypothetical protein [Thermoleophilaceae bacterium]